MEDAKYRVAVVGGCGMWGRYYLRAYAEHPACEIIALVDKAKDRREVAASHYGIKTVFDSLGDLLEREVPDIISLILPVGLNHDSVIACAEAGVRVVSCEKPIAVSLQDADEMVRVCEERGTLFACGTAGLEIPHLAETANWVAEGHIGELVSVAIPGGLPKEISGGGCVQLAQMRIFTGRDVEWVEGWTLPSEGNFAAPEASPLESDCPGYGRLGLAGGIVCEIPEPREGVACRISATGTGGQVWLGSPQNILIEGVGPEAHPVYPDWLVREPDEFFIRVIERLMRAHDTGAMFTAGRDYRQSLEIAIAIKHSDANNHDRIALPLVERDRKLYPHPYRTYGGDVAGWESIGYTAPPDLPDSA
jgi:predicted dehydrogenase